MVKRKENSGYINLFLEFLFRSNELFDPSWWTHTEDQKVYLGNLKGVIMIYN